MRRDMKASLSKIDGHLTKAIEVIEDLALYGDWIPEKTRTELKSVWSILNKVDKLVLKMGEDWLFISQKTEIDIDKVDEVIKKSSGEKQIMKIVESLIEKNGKTITEEDVYKEAKKQKIKADDVGKIIDKLINKGDLFMPRRGLIQKI